MLKISISRQINHKSEGMQRLWCLELSFIHIFILTQIRTKKVTKLVFSLFIIIAMLVFAVVLLQKYVNREAFCNFICFCFFLKHKCFMLYLLEATGLLLLLQGIQDIRQQFPLFLFKIFYECELMMQFENPQ